MKLLDIKTDTRVLLQDEEYNGDTLRMAANWFVYELCNNNRLRMFEDSETLSASAGDTILPFSKNMLAWISMYATAPSVYDLSDSYLEYGEFMKYNAGFATSSASGLRNWTMFGGGMRFAQPLNADHTIQVDFIREPKAMITDASICDIPDRYAELVARGTKARALEIDEDYELADEERRILEPLVTTFIRNEARGGGKTKPTVIRTNRRRSME